MGLARCAQRIFSVVFGPLSRGVSSTWRKAGRGLAVMWGSFTLVFLVFTAVPDPARQLAGQQADPEVIADLRAQFGLDQPPMTRYFKALGGVGARGAAQRWTMGLAVALLGDELRAARVRHGFAVEGLASDILVGVGGIGPGGGLGHSHGVDGRAPARGLV